MADPGPNPASHLQERFEQIREVGSGNFGVARLMREKATGELVVLKFIERRSIDNNVEREIQNMRLLRHPHIIQFQEILLTPTHLAIVMEYAEGGELFDRIVQAGRFTEPQARYYFQQLICGVEYCHRQGICHRDLKLENTLLDKVPSRENPPRVKICDFGYSKNGLMHSQPKSTVGTPAYIAPEVLQRKEYSGYQADVWSCGVTLYVMLVGAYPFEDPKEPRNFRKTIERIMGVHYHIPAELGITEQCQDLLAKIFVAQPKQRITIEGIRQHPWFLTALPRELSVDNQHQDTQPPRQSEEEIRRILEEAKKVPAEGMDAEGYGDDLDYDDVDMDSVGGSGQYGSQDFYG